VNTRPSAATPSSSSSSTSITPVQSFLGELLDLFGWIADSYCEDMEQVGVSVCVFCIYIYVCVCVCVVSVNFLYVLCVCSVSCMFVSQRMSVGFPGALFSSHYDVSLLVLLSLSSFSPRLSLKR
jgi:hypothetical protein